MAGCYATVKLGVETTLHSRGRKNFNGSLILGPSGLYVLCTHPEHFTTFIHLSLHITLAQGASNPGPGVRCGPWKASIWSSGPLALLTLLVKKGQQELIVVLGRNFPLPDLNLESSECKGCVLPTELQPFFCLSYIVSI